MKTLNKRVFLLLALLAVVLSCGFFTKNVSAATKTGFVTINGKTYYVKEEPKDDISEWKEEAMDDEDNWIDVKGEIIYDRIYAKSKKKAMNKLFKMYPEYDINCFGVEEYVMPYCDTEED